MDRIMLVIADSSNNVLTTKNTRTVTCELFDISLLTADNTLTLDDELAEEVGPEALMETYEALNTADDYIDHRHRSKSVEF